MATFTEQFDAITVARMQSFFRTLSERDQRRYAALESQRLGHGGISYIAEILGCSTKTISRGIDELDTLEDDPAAGRVRRPGAGRKKKSSPNPRLSRI
jgi:hypothetical protein